MQIRLNPIRIKYEETIDLEIKGAKDQKIDIVILKIHSGYDDIGHCKIKCNNHEPISFWRKKDINLGKMGKRQLFPDGIEDKHIPLSVLPPFAKITLFLDIPSNKKKEDYFDSAFMIYITYESANS